MASEYMTVEETAAFLKVSEITVKRYIRENLIQNIEQEGQTLLMTDAVERYKKINEQFSRR